MINNGNNRTCLNVSFMQRYAPMLRNVDNILNLTAELTVTEDLFPIEKLAEKLGFAVEEAELPLDVVSRLSMGLDEGDDVIAINRYYTLSERRFGIAFELAYAVLTEHTNELLYSYRGGCRKSEKDVYELACRILMPIEPFRNIAIREGYRNGEQLSALRFIHISDKLADVFKVPEEAASFWFRKTIS